MIFTRTSSGIANFRKFVGSDILVYTEGKPGSTADGEHILDELFYSSLIKHIYPNKNVRIKCVGSRIVALDYASKLDEAELNGNVVIVDRDGEDLVCALLSRKSIIYTYGYSWENDFWTKKIAQKVLEDLACSNTHSAYFCSQFRFAIKRLTVLSALDNCSHINKESLLPKNGGGCGINFKFSSKYVIGHKEVKRLIKKYKILGASTCPLCRSVLPIAMRTKPERAIQGHLWEYVILNLITSRARSLKTPYQVVKNLAMSKFRKNPSSYLSSHTINHYRRELKLRFG